MRQSEADKEIVRQQEKQKREADKEEAGPSGLQRIKDMTLSILLDRPDSESESD